MSGVSTFLCGLVITARSKIMSIAALLVTEAKLYAATMCAQDILFIMCILEAIGLKVKKPMILEIDNKGAKDLIDNWSVDRRMQHVEVKQLLLRELKEAGLIVVKWIGTAENSADLFTKNSPAGQHSTITQLASADKTSTMD